ncbi:hypothetical protein CbC4_7008 (plasmid) [Clostridium botulinum BKT015925]|nr:hypothetical protein [Clostridium botulinum]AEB77619.1 hypothetical protein CbC4_7008 [Clostridium botulinum BKT015925]
MKFNVEIIRKAHQMAKEIKREFTDVDYKTQFGLCLSYLITNKKGNVEMKEFNFYKKGLEFKFKDLELTTYDDDLFLRYKVVGSDDKELNQNSKDGYFNDAKVDLNKKSIKCNLKLNGVEFKGVGLPNDIFKELKESCMELINKREKASNNIVEKLINGELLINFETDGGIGWGHYRFNIKHLKNVLDDCRIDEYRIVEKAIAKMTGRNDINDATWYIERRLNQGLASKDDLKVKAFNIVCDESLQKSYYLKSDMVTSFDMKFSDAIRLDEYLEEKRKKEEDKKNIFEKAKLTGEKQILKKWSEGCNDHNESCDIDNIILYAMPDGTEKK